MVAEFVIATLVIGARTSTGGRVEIVGIRFAHAEPNDVSEHARIFSAAPIRFGAGENAIVLGVGALELAHEGADARLLSVLDRHAHDLLQRLPEVRTFSDRVRTILVVELRGNPSAEHIADKLHMSVRTLSRRLADEGTSHKDVLDEVRHEIAIRHLEAGELSIGEVAFMLGFSEASAFHRAFRRWTGKTPAEYRLP